MIPRKTKRQERSATFGETFHLCNTSLHTPSSILSYSYELRSKIQAAIEEELTLTVRLAPGNGGRFARERRYHQVASLSKESHLSSPIKLEANIHMPTWSPSSALICRGSRRKPYDTVRIGTVLYVPLDLSSICRNLRKCPNLDWKFKATSLLLSGLPARECRREAVVAEKAEFSA